MEKLASILIADDAVAVLGRHVPLRLTNISASGCSFETSSRLDPATTGTIRIMVDGEPYEDDIRVTWCRACEGAALYRVGAQFLWTSSPGERSVRRVLGRAQSRPGMRDDSVERNALRITRHRSPS